MRRPILLAACALAAAACGSKSAAPAPKPALADAVRAARFGPPCRRLVALEWPAGLPVPDAGATGRRFKLFFYPLAGSPGTPTRLATPSAEAVVDADAGAAIECRALPYTPRDFAGPRWTAAASALDADVFDAKVAELDRLTEIVAPVYAARRAPTAADADLARRYLALFETMAEPALLPDYYRLNPEFWEWVRAAAGRSIPKAAAS
jgi:hypothetical protein